MDFRIRRIFPEGLVYFLTAACAAGSFLGLLIEGRSAEALPAGWMHLSLPAKIVVREDPLVDWGEFETAEAAGEVPDESPEIPVAGAPEPEASASEEPIRFEMVGVLNAPDDLMYCFFDTNTRRWFWLTGGGEDTELEVSLSIVDGQPKLMRAGSELKFKMPAR